jgi:predicted lipoprotein with Yx(FWY)xxD motif
VMAAGMVGATTLVLAAAGCGGTAAPEAGDAVATTPTTAVLDGATEPAMPPGGLVVVDPVDAGLVDVSASGRGAQPGGPSHAGVDIRVAHVELGAELGEVLVDADGFVLYAYTGDTGGVPTCDAACADMWPPALADDHLTVALALEEDLFAVVGGTHGRQLSVAGRPLYRFAADVAGQARGQAMADVFFAVAPDGSLVLP